MSQLLQNANRKSYDTQIQTMQFLERLIQLIDDKEHDHHDKPLVLTVKVSIPTLRDHFLCRPDFPKIKAGTKVLVPYQALVNWLNEQV
jgi:hypothetical protein